MPVDVSHPMNDSHGITTPIQSRGEYVTRLETFVDAAFAFAATMLVISVGNVPRSLNEFFDALWHIPNFILCFVLITLFWSAHNRFHRRYGVEDKTTTFYSLALVLTVLIFVFPLRVVFGFGLWFASGGFLPTEIALPEGHLTVAQLEGAFIVYGVGYSTLCGIVWALNHHVLALADKLQLLPAEALEARIEMRGFSINLAVSLISAAVATAILVFGAHSELVAGLPGFVYCLLGILMPMHGRWAEKQRVSSGCINVD